MTKKISLPTPKGKKEKKNPKIEKIIDCVGCDMSAAKLAYRLAGKRIHRGGLTYIRKKEKGKWTDTVLVH